MFAGPMSGQGVLTSGWVDMVRGTGGPGDNRCCAMMDIGLLPIGAAVSVQFQESLDAGVTDPATPVALGGLLGPVTGPVPVGVTDVDLLQTFDRTKRFLRAVVTVAGGSATFDLFVVEQKKQL